MAVGVVANRREGVAEKARNGTQLRKQTPRRAEKKKCDRALVFARDASRQEEAGGRKKEKRERRASSLSNAGVCACRNGKIPRAPPALESVTRGWVGADAAKLLTWGWGELLMGLVSERLGAWVQGNRRVV